MTSETDENFGSKSIFFNRVTKEAEEFLDDSDDEEIVPESY